MQLRPHCSSYSPPWPAGCRDGVRRARTRQSLCAVIKPARRKGARHVKEPSYKPSISDLERLARFFGVPITVIFPQAAPKARTNALLSATADLDDENLEEVTLYAQFRRARQRKKTR